MAARAIITGMGVTSSLGTGIADFGKALKNAEVNFVSCKMDWQGKQMNYPMAELKGFDYLSSIENLVLDAGVKGRAKKMRHLSKSAQTGVYAALEAWSMAAPDHVDKKRIAVVMGGSNTQMQHIHSVHEQYRDRLNFINPNYGLNFFDTDLVGCISEILQVKGEGFSVGAASASGNMCLIQASRLIETGLYDAVVVVAPLMDLSVFEFQGFTSMGAMASLKDHEAADAVYCPFDKARRGFVYGQMAGALILESAEQTTLHPDKALAIVSGYATCLDANRNPNPSLEGEIEVMEKAMAHAGLKPTDIDYVNAHGTASPSGDDTEAEAIYKAGLTQALVNSTKSMTGHGLTAAGLVESIATVVQLQEQFVHPVRLLQQPIREDVNWAFSETKQIIRHALNNSFGFGGVNTSVVISNVRTN